MPAKNAKKIYVENGYYHIYNRGMEKNVIYRDSQDYNIFTAYLKEYLEPRDEADLQNELSDPKIFIGEKVKILNNLRRKNFAKEIVLLAYCLMPNHFHLFLKQNNPKSINTFMSSLGTRYTMYFNKKYKRTGTLYEGVYKAVVIKNDAQFMHLSRYIHKQAIALKNQPCSYPEYLGLRKTVWIHPEDVLSCFSNTPPSTSYRDFVEDGRIETEKILTGLTLE